MAVKKMKIEKGVCIVMKEWTLVCRVTFRTGARNSRWWPTGREWGPPFPFFWFYPFTPSQFIAHSIFFEFLFSFHIFKNIKYFFLIYTFYYRVISCQLLLAFFFSTSLSAADWIIFKFCVQAGFRFG